MKGGNGMAQNRRMTYMILSTRGKAVVSNSNARAVLGQGNVPRMITLGK
jgi:hypothetical protein